MRSSAGGKHVSGAERLVDAEQVVMQAQAMAKRALTHDKAMAERITISVDKVSPQDVVEVTALAPVQLSANSVDEAQAIIRDLMADAGVECTDEVLRLAYSLKGLRGATLVDAASGHRLEPDLARGVRASTFDAASRIDNSCDKNHFQEALLLASKVQSAPGVVAEICLSDDPNYTKGYVACGGKFYRIPNIKPAKSDLGTRVIVVSPDTDIAGCIEYLKNTPVLVDASAAFLQEHAPETEVSSEDSTMTSRCAPTSLDDVCSARNAEWHRRGLSRTLRTFSTAQLPRSIIDGTEYLLFASSDYLGLSTDAEMKAASAQAIDLLGTGSGGSRLTTGTSIHYEVERNLANFFGTPDAVFFATGYQANHSTIAALASADVHIFSDSANHASIIDGCRAAHAQVTVFPHGDYMTLDKLLARSESPNNLVISDAVFSMSGEVADAQRLEEVCSHHRAWLMLDDAHGIGVIGDHGRGTCSHSGVTPDIIVGTASKALGVEGGFVLCSSPVGTLLRNQARSYVYSTSPTPATMAAVNCALKKLSASDVVKRLQTNIRLMRSELGMPELNGPQSAIFPVEIGDENEAMVISEQLRDHGIFIPAIRYPTVPRGRAMLRLTITAQHREEDIRRLGSALRTLGVINRR